MKAFCYLVGNKPFEVVHNDIEGLNQRFIRSIDPMFYLRTVCTLRNLLDDTESQQHAAAMIRLCYRQSLEALFAYCFATLQAPAFIAGWLCNYRDELRALVEECQRGDAKIFNGIGIDLVSWRAIATTVFEHVKASEESKSQIISDFSSAWKALASDFLDSLGSDEYNSTKHGLRAGFGGFKLAAAPLQSNGSAPPDEAYAEILAGKYGMRFLRTKKISPENKADRRYAVEETMTNWDMNCTIARVSIVSHSIACILTLCRSFVTDSAADDGNFAIPPPEDFETSRTGSVFDSQLTFNPPKFLSPLPLADKQTIYRIIGARPFTRNLPQGK